MSTTGDGASGASGMAIQPAAGLLGSEVREGYAEIGDVRLHYVEAGEGPLIVLLHGFPEFWYGWRLQIKPLAAAGFRVVAPDMRGYNLSSKPDGVPSCPKPSCTPITGISSGTSCATPTRPTRRRRPDVTSRRGHSQAQRPG